MRIARVFAKSWVLRLLLIATKVIAILVALILIAAGCVLLWQSTLDLMASNLDLALQNALFVLILLEMFFVIRSFIKYGSINISIVINIGVIAAIKELIFQMNNLTLEVAGAFGVVFVSLAVLYFAEIFSFERKQAADEKPEA